jgi:DNA-binding beta-propeller fold protein YncE
VDTAGNVYLADLGHSRVLKLPAGSTTPVELPFTGLGNPDPAGVAVDTAGNVYVSAYGGKRVLKLPAGSNTQVELPFTALKWPEGDRVGVDCVRRPEESAHHMVFSIGIFQRPVPQCQEYADQPLCG